MPACLPYYRSMMGEVVSAQVFLVCVSRVSGFFANMSGQLCLGFTYAESKQAVYIQ